MIEVTSLDNFKGEPWYSIGSQHLVEEYSGLNGQYYRVVGENTQSCFISKLDVVLLDKEGYPTVLDVIKLRDLEQDTWILVHSENFIYAFESLFIKRTSEGTHIAFAHSKPSDNSVILTPEEDIHYISDLIQLFDIELAVGDFNDYPIHQFVDMFLTPYRVQGGNELIYNLLFKKEVVKEQPDVPYDSVKDLVMVYTATSDTPPTIKTQGVELETKTEVVLV